MTPGIYRIKMHSFCKCKLILVFQVSDRLCIEIPNCCFHGFVGCFARTQIYASQRTTLADADFVVASNYCLIGTRKRATPF